MLEQLFQTDAEQIKIRLIVIFGVSYRLKGIFAGERWQTVERREDMPEVTQAQIDALCRIYGWQQAQPSRVSTMDFLYTFTREAQPAAFSLHSRSTEQCRSRHLRLLAERDYGTVAAPALSTDWKTAKDAIAYGVRCGAFMDEDDSRKEYFAMRDKIQPTTPEQIFKPWLALCQERVAEWERDPAREADTKGIMF